MAASAERQTQLDDPGNAPKCSQDLAEPPPAYARPGTKTSIASILDAATALMSNFQNW